MAGKQKKQEKAAPSGRAQSGAAVSAQQGPMAKLQSFGGYFEDARAELGKVSWPTKKEMKATTFAVLILVVIMAIFLGLADLLLSKIMEAILSMGL